MELKDGLKLEQYETSQGELLYLTLEDKELAQVKLVKGITVSDITKKGPEDISEGDNSSDP